MNATMEVNEDRRISSTVTGTNAPRSDGIALAMRERMSVADLAERARTEMDRYLRHEPSCDAYAFELFRRAICAQDPRAWEALYAQYHDLLYTWVRRHPASHTCPGEDEVWVADAFARFWQSMNPERFRTFPSIAAVLRYMKLCVHSVLLDDVRARSRAHVFTQAYERDDASLAGADMVEVWIGDVDACALWDAVSAEVRDEAEAVVARQCLGLGMKPRAVFEHKTAVFPRVEDVYRVKRNLLERLQRNATIRSFLSH
jgi:DNA-directed RNA polymerase specialized sigma24 family protein